MRSAERGIALLEVLAATAILAFAGLSALELLRGEVQSLAGERISEAALADEERLLATYTLLDRVDLERRLGARAIGPYVVEVQRPTPLLFRITIAGAGHPGAEDLVTVVHRPRSDDAR
jgi:type II secretory pathway pseudopilin PulG